MANVHPSSRLSDAVKRHSPVSSQIGDVPAFYSRVFDTGKDGRLCFEDMLFLGLTICTLQCQGWFIVILKLCCVSMCARSPHPVAYLWRSENASDGSPSLLLCLTQGLLFASV